VGFGVGGGVGGVVGGGVGGGVGGFFGRREQTFKSVSGTLLSSRSE
jgi:hypothetical protein